MTFKQYIQFINEGTGFTINDLKTWVPSWRNRYFYDIRKREGNTGSFLKYIDWNEKQNYIRLIYHIIPTYNKKIKIVSSTKSGKIYESDHYECILELEDVNQIIGTKEDFLSLKPKEQEKSFREFINKTTIKVQGNDKSWFFQGVWENLHNALKSVYPFPEEFKGKQIWAKRHNRINQPYLTKHLIEVIGTVPFLISKICKMIREESEEVQKIKKPITPVKPEQLSSKVKKSKEEPSNQTVDLSAITKVPAPRNVNIHQEVSARLMPAFNLVRNKKDWKLPIDKTIEADQKTIDDVEEAIQYFTGSPPEIKKIGKNLYKVKAAGYYKSMGDFKV